MSRVAQSLSLIAGGGVSAPSESVNVTSPGFLGEGDRSAQPNGGGVLARPQRSPSTSFAGPPPPEIWGRKPTLSELFAAHPRDAGWAGFLLPQVDRSRPLLWVQERMAILESGRIYPPGLGLAELIHVDARDARTALWAMEEGLRCAALSAVIGELWGDPASLDFTATRRLAVAAERSGVACWLVRLGGSANLSGARMRWRIGSDPSLPNPFDPRASGPPAWDAELFRSRSSPPGRWSITRDGTADAFHLVAGPGDRTLGEDERLTA